MTDLLDVVKDVFEKRYGEPPQVIVRAPGRVNLIGEHTDYNDGFVLPIAIDRATWIAFRPTQDGQVRLHSLDFDADVAFDLARLSHKPGQFVDYLEGVAWGLQEAGYSLRGFEGVMAGNVPIGAGLSSSAALELATAKAFSEASGFAWHAVEMAKLSQYVENKWVGLQCGIMDQLISAVGERDHAVLIDCRSLETKLALIPPGSSVVVLDTGTRRGLVGEAYNERRQQCEAVAAHFSLPALRDVSLDQLEREQGQIDAVNYRRARHIVTENQRTLDAYDAMQNEDAVRLGQLMDASHDSLRDDFEVSSAALNAMVDLARQQPGCLGARMTGAGFGGCAVALVDSAYVEQFQQDVAERYRAQTSNDPQLYLCVPSDGARTI